MLFALIHHGPILPVLAKGVNRQVLAIFWRFCTIAKTVGRRQRPSGLAMREKQRDSGVKPGFDRFLAHPIAMPARVAPYPHLYPLYTPCIPHLNPL